jgi:hypothetical protein
MVSALLLVFTAVVALAAGHGAAFDPNPLQDFCVADSTSKGLLDPSIPCFSTHYLLTFGQ